MLNALISTRKDAVRVRRAAKNMLVEKLVLSQKQKHFAFDFAKLFFVIEQGIGDGSIATIAVRARVEMPSYLIASQAFGQRDKRFG